MWVQSSLNYVKMARKKYRGTEIFTFEENCWFPKICHQIFRHTPIYHYNFTALTKIYKK